MIWKVPKIWQNGDVYILGGGSSVTRQFNIPDKIIQDVVNKVSKPDVYSPYMSFLHDKHVIGINVAYLIGNWIDICFFGDVSFLTRESTRLAEFPGLKVSCHPVVENYDWIKYLPRDRRPRGISNNPHTVCWNCNSGSAAISLAVNAGAKRIILLGFDMKLNNNGDQHWHDEYNRRGKIDIRKIPFNKHLMGFPAISMDAKRMGVEILNASDDTEIKNFPIINIKDLMK